MHIRATHRSWSKRHLTDVFGQRKRPVREGRRENRVTSVKFKPNIKQKPTRNRFNCWLISNSNWWHRLKMGNQRTKSGKRKRERQKQERVERRLSKQHVNEMQIKCGNRIRTRTPKIEIEVDSWWLTPVCSLFSFNISFACTVHLFAYLFVGVWSALPLVDFRLNTSRIFAWFTRRCTQTLTPSSHSSISLSLSGNGCAFGRPKLN